MALARATPWAVIVGACLILSACALWGDDDSEEDLLAIVQATLTAEAEQATPTPTATTPPEILPTPTPSSADERSPNIFDIGWESAQIVSIVIELVDAYNAGEVEQVLSLLTADANWADCDYHAGERVIVEDREEIREWLEVRMANEDQLEVVRMWNQNPSSATVLAVDWGTRQSDELRAQGFEAGIELDRISTVPFRRENGQLLVQGFSVDGDPCEIDAQRGAELWETNLSALARSAAEVEVGDNPPDTQQYPQE